MPRRWPILLVGLLAFVALCVGPLVSSHHGQWFSGWSGIGGIEDKLEADAAAVLESVGDYEVTASGQDLTVTSSATLANAVQNDLAAIDGVRSVDFTQLSPAEPEAEADEEVDEVVEPTPAAAPDETVSEPEGVDAALAISQLDLGSVTFGPGTAILTDSAQTSLDAIAAELQQYPDVAIEVQGHTDSTGDPDVNLLLSQDRATAVTDYLIGAGVNASTLTATGYGGSRPLADNTTEAGQTANRRVELVVDEGTN